MGFSGTGLSKPEAFIQQWDKGHEWFEFQTSGSTGVPKTIQASRSAMIQSARLTGQVLGLQQGENALLCLPIDFIAGKMMVVRSKVWKMNLVIAEPTANPLLSVQSHIRIDFAAMTPLQVSACIGNPATRPIFENIRNILIGGAPVSPCLQQQLHGFTNVIYETFGMTETLTHIALRRLNGPDADDYFKVLPGVEVATDDRGCLAIYAPHLDQPHIITNDLVELADPKRFRWLGRNDHVINSGGIKIIPEQVEKQLGSVIRLPFVIVGVPDETLGTKAVLLIEDPNAEQEMVYRAGTEKYAEYSPLFEGLSNPQQKPREIRFVHALPKTISGKIIRQK